MWTFGPPFSTPGEISTRTGSNTPDAFTTERDNLALNLTAKVFYISSTSDLHVTGIVASIDTDIIILVNVGAYAIVLDHESGSSSSGNQFIMLSGTYYPIAPNGVVSLMYDGSVSKWRPINTNSGA